MLVSFLVGHSQRSLLEKPAMTRFQDGRPHNLANSWLVVWKWMSKTTFGSKQQQGFVGLVDLISRCDHGWGKKSNWQH